MQSNYLDTNSETVSNWAWSCVSGNESSSSSLISRINQTIEWAELTVKIVDENNPIWCPKDNSSIVRPIDKMLLEASVLALIVGRCKELRPAAIRLINEIVKHEELINRLYRLLIQRPHLRSTIGILWIALDEFNCCNQSQINALKRLWHEDPSPTQHQERVPYRILDQAWIKSLALGKIDEVIITEALLPFTSLGNISGIIFMNRDDLYALTHTAMYMTNFGSWHYSKKFSSNLIGASLLKRLLDKDYDLVAELALTEILVGHENANQAQILARVVLNDIFDSIGCIPALSFAYSEYKTMESKEVYLRFHSYHTTFVYAILCYVVLLKRKFDFEPELSKIKNREWQLASMSNKQSGNESSEAHELVNRIATHTLKYSDDCIARKVPYDSEGSDLLRGVIDAHLIEAVEYDNIDHLIQLMKMDEVAGKSEVSDLIKSYLLKRSSLSVD